MNVAYAAAVGVFAGVAGTGAGAFVLFLKKNRADAAMPHLLCFSAALMVGVSVFDALPHALSIAPLPAVIFSAAAGAVMPLFLDGERDDPAKSLLIPLLAGIALHNIPEGIAVGAGFAADTSLGYSVFAAILIHDIPEGMVVAACARASGFPRYLCAVIAAASGLPTGIGAAAGALFGGVGSVFSGISLSIAAGVMLGLSLFGMLPRVRTQRHFPIAASAAGIALSLAITYIF